MFRLTLLISAIFVASVLSGFGGPDGSPDGGPNGGEGKHKHHKKMMQCMKQTNDLQESCCPFPRDDSVKDDPVCKEHLEGIEEKEGKEKHRAMKCWFDCIYKSKGLIEEKKLQKDATLNYFDEMLTKLEAEDFKAVTEESIEYCFAEIENKQDKWAATWNKTKNADGEEKKKCSMLPGAFTMCILGNVVRNCPESQWQSNDDCTALKANATSMEDCMKH